MSAVYQSQRVSGNAVFAPQLYESGSETTVSPGDGHGVFAGHSPTVAQSANQSTSPSPAHGGYTGHTPTVISAANVTISPSVGHGNYTGYQSVVTQSAGIVVAPGSAIGTFAGHQPVISQPHEVSPGKGAEVFNGYAPTAYASSGFIRAPSGSGPTVIQPGSYRPSNTGGRRY